MSDQASLLPIEGLAELRAKLEAELVRVPQAQAQVPELLERAVRLAAENGRRHPRARARR